MNNSKKPALSTIKGNLGRHLRAFLANARYSSVTASQWTHLKETCLSNLEHTDPQTVQSCMTALKKYRECVDLSEMHAVIETTVERLTRLNKLTLLNVLLNNVFVDVSASPHGFPGRKREGQNSNQVPPQKRPRVSSAAQMDETASEPSVLRADTFYLLRSDAIPVKRHTIALDEIVTAGADLTVICNFKFDIPWMFGRAPALQTSKKILIVHGETTVEEAEWSSFLAAQGLADRVRFQRPRTPPYGTVHSKMFFLFFPAGCRVCIHTANMIASDWDFKTQGAYVRDFPLRERIGDASSASHSVCEDDFRTQLERYFQHALTGQECDDVVKRISKYDFSSAGGAFVSSVPGIHKGFSRLHFGHARLRELLVQQSINEGEGDGPSVAVCQFSSLGSVQKKWLEEEFRDTLFASKERNMNNAMKRAESDEIKLVFPTLEQVRESIEGLQAGASLPVKGKNMNMKHILNKLHRWDARHSGRDTAMPHIKTFLRYPSSKPHAPSWMFLGSFNMSVAAWGRMQGARKGRHSWDRLNVLSFETGILFSPQLACPPAYAVDASIKYCIPSVSEKKLWDASRKSQRISLETADFTSSTNEDRGGASRRAVSCSDVVLTLPLPYRLPPPKYLPEDTPWTVECCSMM